jgi:hypothetical protein
MEAHQYGQHGLFYEYDGLCELPGASGADQQSGGVWGRVVGGTVDSAARTIDKPNAQPIIGFNRVVQPRLLAQAPDEGRKRTALRRTRPLISR